MDAKIFERCLIWLVCKKADECDPPKNDTHLSNGVFDVGHPVNAWRSTRNSTRTLSLQEAYRLAEAIGLSLDRLCWDVFNELRNGWTMEQDVSLSKPNPGRPPAKKLPLKKENSENQSETDIS